MTLVDRPHVEHPSPNVGDIGDGHLFLQVRSSGHLEITSEYFESSRPLRSHLWWQAHLGEWRGGGRRRFPPPWSRLCVGARSGRRGAPRAAAGAHEDGHDDPMPSSPARARRGRGRPRKSEGLETAQALLDAAAEVCAEWGFDGTTIARVAARGGVTPAAIYNHYESREELLYASAVQGLERITTLSLKLMGAPDATPAIASAYLRPEMRVTRRLLAELHLASGRDERLAELLAGWHRSWAKAMTAQLPADDPSAPATVKAIFLLLLGLCHYDDLPAVRAPRAAVAQRAEQAFSVLATFERS